jgi:hypothetical protein
MKSQQLQDTALRYFLEVVRCGSISEASQRLNVASSAISRQISSLEETLDTVLFERRPRGMVLSAVARCWPRMRARWRWKPTAWWPTCKP